MSGLHSQNFSPARTLSPHIRTTSDVDRQAIKAHNLIRFFLAFILAFDLCVNLWMFCLCLYYGFLQSVLDRAVSRVPETRTLRASPSYLQPTLESRLVFLDPSLCLCFSQFMFNYLILLRCFVILLRIKSQLIFIHGIQLLCQEDPLEQLN